MSYMSVSPLLPSEDHNGAIQLGNIPPRTLAMHTNL